MDKVRRVLVYMRKERAAPQQAHFLQVRLPQATERFRYDGPGCRPGLRVFDELVNVSRNGAEHEEVQQSLTGFFSDGDDEEVQVSCSLQRNQFILSSADEGRRVPLKRASFCPIKNLSPAEAAAIPPEVQQRGVDVGVSIMLQTADQRVLLTRRAKELRIFPNVWVPPGGHVEPEETMLGAGLRELQEETGLRLHPEEVSSRVLGLWESVFPPLLSRGLPHRHHVVVYMLLLSPLSHLQLQSCLNPSPAEVSACVWVDSRLARAVVDGEDGEVPVQQLPSSFSVMEVSADGALRHLLLPLATFTGRVPSSGPDTERVSTGTKYALDLWLRSLETPPPPSCEQPQKMFL